MANKTVIGLDDTHGLIMSPITAWNTLSPDVQYLVSWGLGICALLFFLITIATIFLLGGAAGTSSLQRDASGHNKYILGIAKTIATVLCVILGVAFAFSVYF